MPLARITTPLPEYYERLAQDLRARGFDVETATPGQFLPSTADLEITVKQCGPEDVARLTAAASANKDMCVVVTAGAREGGIRSVEMIMLQPKEATVRTPGFRATPAQVIEIASALADSNGMPAVQDQATPRERPENWPKVKVAAVSTWEEVVKTTMHWLTSTMSAFDSAWTASSKSVVPLTDFFLEIGHETRKLGQRLLAAILPKSRSEKQADAENEQLVPSIFDLSSEERVEGEALPPVEEQEVIVKRDPQTDVPVDRRFAKAAGVAAVAGLAVLLAISVMHRPGQTPVLGSQNAVDIKGPLPASASLKPSATVVRGAQKTLVASSAHVLPAHQVMSSDSEAEDTTVRYKSRPKAPKNADTRAQIRRYSDLD